MSLTNTLIRAATPKNMPLSAPEARGHGRVRQSMTPFSLKPLAGADHVAGPKVKATDEHSQLTAQAQKLVSQAFFGAMLKQMHNSPFKAKWVDGGHGGEAFQPLMDQRYVDHLAHSASGQRLANTVVRKIEGGRAYAKTKKASTDVNQLKIAPDEAATNPGSHVTPGTRA